MKSSPECTAPCGIYQRLRNLRGTKRKAHEISRALLETTEHVYNVYA